MSTWTKYIVMAGIAAVITSCSPYRHIYTNYDKSTDFSSYHTFAWTPDSTTSTVKVPPDLAAYDNDIVRNNAKNYISYTLTKRGLLVNTDSPDVVLELVLLNEKKEKVMSYEASPYAGYYYYNPYYFPYYYPYYRYYTWYGWSYPPYWERTVYTRTYVKGTITINVYERASRKLVWTGSAEGDIYDPAYIQFDVHPAIDRIMRQFPIKPVARPRRLEIPKGKNVVLYERSGFSPTKIVSR
jgi:hypothetical protein